MNPRWKKLAGFALYLVVLLEVSTRVAVHIYLTQICDHSIYCIDDDTMTRYAYAYRVSEGVAQQFPNGLWVHDPRRGYALAPGLDNAPHGDFRVSSNGLGARGAREVPHERRAGYQRVVAIGDSFTFGDGVADDEAWPAFVETLLDRTEVINLGVSAYAHDQILLTLQDQGVQYRPDVVVFGYFGDDIRRNARRFLCYEKPRFTLEDGVLVLEGVPVPTVDDVVGATRWRPMFPAVSGALFAHAFWDPDWENRFEVTSRIMDQMVDTARQANSRIVFVYLAPQGHWSSPEYALFRAYCSTYAVECLDTSDHLGAASARTDPDGRAELPRRYFLEDQHYSAEGHRAVAELVAAHLRGTGAN